MSTPMFVKVAKLGNAVKELYLCEGASVGQALREAGMSAEKFSIRVNGVNANENTVLYNNAVVTLVPEVKGGRS